MLSPSPKRRRTSQGRRVSTGPCNEFSVNSFNSYDYSSSLPADPDEVPKSRLSRFIPTHYEKDSYSVHPIDGEKPKDDSHALAVRELIFGTGSSRVLTFGDKPKFSPTRGNNKRAGGGSSHKKESATQQRKRVALLPNNPDRMLDAPGVLNSPFANILSWANGVNGVSLLAIALGSALYSWDPVEKKADHLHSLDLETKNIAALAWYPGYEQVAFGTDSGEISVFDVRQGREINPGSWTVPQRDTGLFSHAYPSAIAWNSDTLTYGSSSGVIAMMDVRTRKPMSFQAHSKSTTICSITYTTTDPVYFATSGYTENPENEKSQVVQVWDTRMIGSRMDETPCQTLRTESSTKGLKWTPWVRNTLITGSQNGQLAVWNVITGQLVGSTTTGRSINAVIPSPTYQELLTTHYGPSADNIELQLWTGKALKPITPVGKHAVSIISADISPDGETVCVATSDETLKFWQLFPKSGAPARSKSRSSDASMSGSNLR